MSAAESESDAKVSGHRYDRAINLWLARLAAAIAVAGTVVFITHGLTSARSFVSQRRQYAPMSLYSRETADGAGLNVAFLSWAQSQMLAGERNDATFWFASAPASSTQPQSAEENTQLYQYSMYLLAPARSTTTPEAAQWIVLYGQTLSSMRLEPRSWHVIPFSAGYSLARRRQ